MVIPITRALPLIILLLVSAGHGGEEARIGLYGDSFMAPVQASLDRLGLSYQRLGPGTLDSVDPRSFQVLFVAYDAADDSTLLDWIDAFGAGGGRLFTFFVLPERLQQLMGHTSGRLCSSRVRGPLLPHLPAAGIAASAGSAPEVVEHLPRRAGLRRCARSGDMARCGGGRHR